MLVPSDKDQRIRVSVEQAEADYHAEVHKLLESEKDPGRAETLRKPFGFQNETWEALKAQLRPGDELWEFCSARSSWEALMGHARYELRRDGVVIATVMTRRN